MSDEDVVRIQEQIVSLFKNDDRLEGYIGKIQTDIEDLKRVFANRPPLWTSTIIALLMGLIGWLAGGR